MQKSLLRFSSFLFLLTSCVPKLENPAPSSGDADFTKTIAIGGDFMAGYQDGALFHDGQARCIPALLDRQFALTGNSGYQQQAFLDNDGIGWNPKPWESWYVTASKLRFKTDCQGLNSLMPVWDSIGR